MTVLLPAWLQSGAYTAEHDRFVGTALLNPGTALTGRGGIRRVVGDEWQVSPTAPPTMSVQVGAGMAFVQGVYTATQGVYVVVNDGVFQLTVSAAHSTLARIDTVVLEILDQMYAGATNLAQVRILQGTPASNPAPPTPTGSFITLAQILVPAGSTSIVSTNITDVRPFTTSLGAPIPVRNVTERNALLNKYDGMSVYMMDNAYELHTYANGEWYGSTPRFYGVTSANFIMDNPVDYLPRVIIDRAKIPDPGFRYSVRLDADMEVWGTKLNCTVFCENTTTTSFSNEVAGGFSLANYTIGTSPNRLDINRVFPATYTGNRWVTLRVAKDPAENAAIAYSLTSNKFSFQMTMLPVRPTGFVVATSVGGQP